MLDVNAVQVELHGSGALVTIRFFAAKKEAADGLNDANTEALLAAAAQGLGLANAVFNPSRPGEKPATPSTGSEAVVPQPEAPSAGGRRRRGQSAPVETPPPAEQVAPAAVGPGGRRRRTAGAAPATADPAATTPPVAPATASAPPEVTDLDLVKACSIAATKITPAKVQAVLDTFGVGKVNKLTGADRQKFLDALKAA